MDLQVSEILLALTTLFSMQNVRKIVYLYHSINILPCLKIEECLQIPNVFSNELLWV